jgi:hypothetical protein
MKRESRNPSTQGFTEWMEKVRGDARDALERSAEQMKWQFNKQCSPSRSYKLGDQVWVKANNLPMTRLMGSLMTNGEALSRSKRKEASWPIN